MDYTIDLKTDSEFTGVLDFGFGTDLGFSRPWVV